MIYRAPIRVRPPLRGVKTTLLAARLSAKETAPAISPFDLSAIVNMVEELKRMHESMKTAIAHVGSMEELKKLHAEMLAKHEQILSSVAAIKKGDAGAPGKHAKEVDLKEVARLASELVPKPKDGDPGDTPIIDEKKIAKRAAKLVKIPEPIAPKEIDEEAMLQKIAERLRIGEIKIPAKHIDGLENKFTEVHSKVRSEVEQYGKNTWKRGGGDTVVAGNNVTITTNGSGQKVISSSGGSGFTSLNPTETPNGILKVFTFALASAHPSYIVSDNVWMKATSKAGTVNWTWNSGAKQATMTIPPQDDIEGIV